MARYEHLSIFEKAMEMSVYIAKSGSQFLAVTTSMASGLICAKFLRQIIRLIIRANSGEEKAPILKDLVEACEQFKATLVLTKGIKAFYSFKSFQHVAGLATILCRQSEG